MQYSWDRVFFKITSVAKIHKELVSTWLQRLLSESHLIITTDVSTSAIGIYHNELKSHEVSNFAQRIPLFIITMDSWVIAILRANRITANTREWSSSPRPHFFCQNINTYDWSHKTTSVVHSFTQRLVRNDSITFHRFTGHGVSLSNL